MQGRSFIVGPSWVLCLLGLVIGCTSSGGSPSPDAGPPPDACTGVTCGDFGRCEIVAETAVCHCRLGYDAVGLDCVYAGKDLCADAPCTAGCDMTADNGARCTCGGGERVAGLACVAADAPACAGVACSGHGTCQEGAGGAACACDDGYEVTPDGLGCARVAPEEACASSPDASCVAGRSYEACCQGLDCEYRFEDGSVYRGLSSAAGYCRGQDVPTGEDGLCAGEATDCMEQVDAASCQGNPGCVWRGCTGSIACTAIGDRTTCEADPTCVWDPLCYSNNPQARHCSNQDRSAACGQMAGCHWVDVPAGDDWRCSPPMGNCIPGRSYRLCCDGPCEARFEDGKVFRGAETVQAYCLGLMDDPTEDGSCLSNCSQITDEATCNAVENECDWQDYGECKGADQGCLDQYGSAECNARASCYWSVDESLDGARVGDLGNFEFTEDAIGAPRLESPPYPPGSDCPADCGVGCVFAYGRDVDLGNGFDKRLGNQDFCLPPSSPILAVIEGTVTATTDMASNDHELVIESSANPNFWVLYDHVTTLEVSVGDAVRPGDLVATGYMGSPGIMHSGFELTVNEKRGPAGYQNLTECPERYTTSAVNADLSTRLLQVHTRSNTGFGEPATGLCERAWLF